MVSALGASIVFQNAVMLIYGARVYVYPENLIPTLTFNIFGLNVPVMRIIVIVSSLVLMLALYAFINPYPYGDRHPAPSPSIRARPGSWASTWTA